MPSKRQLFSNPVLYDALQFVTGAPIAARIMRRWLADARGLVVDVGGGTGRLKDVLPPGTRHVCVDVDPQKLAGYVAKFQDARPLFGDALNLPVRSGAAQAVTLVAVSHHLTDQQFAIALEEIDRSLAPTGTFFFLDGIFAPQRIVSRWLWRYDGGAHPRSSEELLGRLRDRFTIVDSFEYTVWHSYLACRCERR
jgi:SAM-dependent methyltransferase